MKLSVMISTIDKRIENLPEVIFKPVDNVEYIIIHQYTSAENKNIPPELIRSDTVIKQLKGQGVTASRNLAIQIAMGDIGWMTDDDVQFDQNLVEKIFSAYQRYKADIIFFKIQTPHEKDYKKYMSNPCLINSISEHSPSAIEMTVNLRSVKNSKLYFDERFGRGTKLLGGDEKVFMFDALKKGMKIYFIPEVIVYHPLMSTTRLIAKYDKKKIQLTGAIDYRLHGKIAFIKAPFSIVRIISDILKNKVNLFYYIKNRLRGIWIIYQSE